MQEPLLTNQQQIDLFQAVGHRVLSVVTNTRGKRIAEQIPEIASIPLLGAFVSLKRHGHLRSCMGAMADEMPLSEAVELAAVRAAKDDPRFPPIASAELEELDMEVWVLWGMKKVARHGLDRLHAVEIGKHGVQIVRGGDRGLLLPGVAVDHEMDALAFLEAVCRKAGLPQNAWSDDRSTLYTFEGRAIRGPFSAVEIENIKAANDIVVASRFQRPLFQEHGPTSADVEALRKAAEVAFHGMVDGIPAPRFFPGFFDGNISGVSVVFTIPDRAPLVCSKIAVQPDVSLQTSIIELLRALGTQLNRFGMTRQELRDSTLDLLVLWDPTIHGNARQHDLSKVDTARRSMMLSSPIGWVVRYMPGREAEDVLSQCVEYLELADLNVGEVLSFESVGTANEFLVTSVSKPNRGPEIRQAAVAGAFYPADKNSMNDELDRLFQPSPDREQNDKPSHYPAVLIPHAGWVYSGRLAAETLSKVVIPERAIILAPKHRSGGCEWAVAPNRIWNYPGGTMESDLDLAEKMIGAVDFFQFDAGPHAREHSIEVQIPLLARLNPQMKIVGGVMAMSSWNMIQLGASQFAKFYVSLPEKPLLIISSDMNHFASDESTRTVDGMAIDAIRTLDPSHILETILENQISMCGVVPLVFVLETLKTLCKLNGMTLVGYTTSAEASGDKTRVVGYAGILFR